MRTKRPGGGIVRRLLVVAAAIALLLPVLPAPALAAVAAPVIVAPVNGSHHAATPVFGWEAVAGAGGYRVEIAGPDGFSPAAISRTTVNRWLTTAEALPHGAVTWRVAAIAGDGTRGPWATGSFTVDIGLVTPVLTPATVHAPWPSTPRVLAWDPVPGAAGYDLRLTAGSPDVLDDIPDHGLTVVAGPRFVAQASEEDGLPGTLYWQVRARGAGGLAVSAWSEVGELRASWTASPQPITPDGAVLVERMILDWARLPGATGYRVEVEPLDGQGATVVTGGSASHTDVRAFTGDDHYGLFRWRVRGMWSRGTYGDPFSSAWSGWRTVTVLREAGPALLGPADGATVPGVPRIAWVPVAHRTRYLLQLSTDPAFTTGVKTVLADDTVLEAGTESLFSSAPKPLDLADGETYHWRVQALGGKDRGGGWQTLPTEWSAVRSFTVDAPAIDLVAPADGATVEVPSLRWDASRGLSFAVTIRDRHGETVAAGVTSAGRWTPATRLDPADGPFTWSVRAVSLDDEDVVIASSGTRTFELEPVTAVAAEAVATDPPPDEPWFTMTWTPVAGADHYAIWRSWSGDVDPQFLLAGDLAYPAYTDTGRWTGSPEFGPSSGSSWRIIAYAADGSELSRGPSHTVDIPRLPAPVALGPADCTEAACGTPASPTFSWSPVPDASMYRVTVWPEHYPQGANSVETLGTTARLQYVGLNTRRLLRWTVAACTMTGCSEPTAQRSTWFSRVVPEHAGPAAGAVVEDEVIVGYAGGVPPEAPPGVEPAWTYQDPAYDEGEVPHVAGPEPAQVTWGFLDYYDGTSRTITLQASTPDLLVPADAAVTDASPLLAWTPISYARAYVVQVHRGGSEPLGRDTVVAAALAEDASLVLPASLPPGTYRWRVQRGTPNAFGYGWDGHPWSGVRTFTVPEADPAVPLGPADGATRTPEDLLLTWSPVPGASAYRVELSRDAAFGVLGYAALSATTGWAPGSPLSGGEWHWRVQALSGGDTPISTSAGRALTVDAPVLKPLRNAVVVADGNAFAWWHDTTVDFPIARETGAVRVRLSNDGTTWSTRPWTGDPISWDLAPTATDGPNGESTAASGAYTVWGQWEDLQGNWSAVATDTVVFDNDTPVAAPTLDGGAATTADAEVLLDPGVVDAADGAGVVEACNAGEACRLVSGGAPIPWTLGDPGGAPGPRVVCVRPFDVRTNDGEQACTSIEYLATAAPSSPGNAAGLRYGRDSWSAAWPIFWRSAERFTVTPVLGASTVPTGSDVCTWELRWGDHAALRDAAVNGTGGGVMTSGTAAEGFCSPWSFDLPEVASGMVTISFTARTRDGTLIAATPSGWAGRPRFAVIPDDPSPPVTGSSLPIVTLAVEGSETPGATLVYSATARQFTPTTARLTGRSPSGAVVTSPNGTSLSVPAPEEGRWSVRWSGQRGTANVAAYLDPVSSMLDTTAPRVTAPVARPRTGIGLGSTVPVRVRWSGSDASSGIARYEVAVSRNGGAWGPVKTASPGATSVDLSLARTGSYRYRVRAVDGAGNGSGWMEGTVIRPVVVDDRSATVRGSWSRRYASSYSGGSLRSTTSRGASASYTFTGSAIAWVAATGPTRGRATVYLDGRSVATVNLRTSGTHARRQVFSYAWPVAGRHTIRIVAAGTPGHPRVDVDAFVVLR